MLRFSLSAMPATVFRIFFIGSLLPSSPLPRCFLLGGAAMTKLSEDWDTRGRGWVCDSCATTLTSSSRSEAPVPKVMVWAWELALTEREKFGFAVVLSLNISVGEGTEFVASLKMGCFEGLREEFVSDVAGRSRRRARRFSWVSVRGRFDGIW
jgi:hypothetical protein